MRGMAHPPTHDTDNERVGIYLLWDRVQELSLEMGVKVHGSCGNYAERIYKVYIKRCLLFAQNMTLVVKWQMALYWKFQTVHSNSLNCFGRNLHSSLKIILSSSINGGIP
jgi:hypothetical protein